MNEGQVLVCCPECGFSKPVDSQKLAGGQIRITCPKCKCKFYMDKNGVSHSLSGKQEEDIHEIARKAYEKEQHRFDEEIKATASILEKPSTVPWALAPEGGWVSGFTRTILGVMLQAPQFAAHIGGKVSLVRPLLFYLVIIMFYTGVELFWMDAMLSFIGETGMEDPRLKEILDALASNSDIAYTTLIRSALYVLQLYLASFLMYLIYELLAPGKMNFNIMFQIIAYGVAPMLFCVIPGIGSLVGMFWSIGCVAVCCKTITGLDWPRTLAGFLPPLLILFLAIGQSLKFLGQF